jgi:hypothetical protein
MGYSAEEVQSRIQEQARAHWHEFSVIVASANVLLALILCGRVITDYNSRAAALLGGGIALASIIAAMLAYYSIQVGSVLISGNISLFDIVFAFLITATQLAMFLWPAHAIAASSVQLPELKELRHWLLFFAGFALTGAATNFHASRSRRLAGVSPQFGRYEKAQRNDRLTATVTGIAVVLLWLVSLIYYIVPVTLGVALAIASATFGLLSQARTAETLREDTGA